MARHSCCGQGGGACGAIVTERNRYFTGKFMTERDFTGEQEYTRSRHQLHNRLLHGWGIVCGLEVKPHPHPDCADRWVVVTAGIAIDCCGRELILRETTPFQLKLPPQPDDPYQGHGEKHPSGRKKEGYDQDTGGYADWDDVAPFGVYTADDEPMLDEPLLLCVSYAEEQIELTSPLYAERDCDPTRLEANRVREVAQLSVRRLSEAGPGCWPDPDGDAASPCQDDCGATLCGMRGCLEPVCPCGGAVPLALISPADSEYGKPRCPKIDCKGRRSLPAPSQVLTHITHINWPHGGELTLAELADRQGRLEIRFDRPLLEADGDATGVNPFTFVVQYSGAQRDLETLGWDNDHPPQFDEETCSAVFTIDSRFYQARRQSDLIAGNTVFVTLKCDFIMDCHGNPVDGEYLRGQLPSGDGRPGGLFESWFKVVADRPDRGRREGPRYDGA